MSNEPRGGRGKTGPVELVVTVEQDGETVHEFPVQSFTDVKDRFVFLDEEGEGRLLLTGEELAALAKPGRGWSE